MKLSADLGALGSTYAGNIDRRALALRLRWETDALGLYGQAIVDYYGADHPSGLSSIDASFLSLEGRVTVARATVSRPASIATAMSLRGRSSTALASTTPAKSPSTRGD